MATKSVDVLVTGAGASAISTGDAIGAADAIDYTAVAAAIAVLVADGASPTQAHVTTLNSAWTTLKGLIDAATAAAPATTAASVLVSVDTSITANKLRAGLDKAYEYLVKSSGVISV